MSTMHPTGDGGGGPTSTTSTDDNMTPVTPSTEIVGLPGSHHHHHPPPSPLSGCYLLVVLPEPHTAQHRDLILNRLAKGFLSWDKDSCHVDLEKELQALVAQAPEGEEARNGERLIQYATENLVTEVLIHPQTNTLLQCVRNLLASFTKHRHIIHAGYTFSGNGSWILQDGTFSLADFLDAFSEHDVQRVLRAYENSVTVDINCAGVGEWSTARLSKEACTRSCRVRLNPDDVLTAGVPAITSFTNYVGQYLVSQTLDQLMEPSDVVGNIRFSHPTLYVFPGGQGDAALFGINGFNMLVDGGFARKACFWDFARHLDRLDAVLITRINNSNVGGMSSILRKKKEMQVYPQIGHFFSNLIERKHSNSPDGDKDLDPLILNLTDIGQEMMVDLRKINLRAHPCYRDPSPINLYHKVGHGTLDMYVLSPSKDSREVREFLTKWHASDSKLFSGSYRKDSNNLTFPIQNLASICALIVWQPANPEDTITRILFPGSTPQHKIFEGIERLKHLEFLKHPVCTAKSLSPSTSILALKDRSTMKQKLGLIEETKKSSEIKRDKRDLPESKLSKGGEELGSKTISQASPIIPIPKAQPAKIEVKTKKAMDNKKLETESKKIEKGLKEMKKESMKKDFSKIEKDSDTKKLEGYRIKMDNEKTTLTKESKVKSEPGRKEIKESKPHKVQKTELLSKPYAKIPDKKPKPLAEKKDSVKASPTPTPKKSTSASVPKVDLAKTAPRPITKPTSKQIASIMPAKSAKDANNRKVVEQKNIEIASAAIATAPAIAKLPAKQKAAERKPIGRRTKAVSPKKGRVPLSPSKSTRSTPTTSVKSDNDGVISKVKGDRGTTDSSTVSTPSGIEIDSMAKLADKSLTEKSEDMSIDSIESKVLADLKEEREVVEEIEAVLQKAERIEGARGEDHLDGDDDVTAEATDKKEEDMTEDDVTADIEELPKKEISRKTSHELTEEDEYLIIEKEEIYIEDSIQSGEGEQKHLLDAVESETAKKIKDEGTAKDEEEEGEEEEEEEEEGEAALEEEAEVSEGKEKTDVPEKRLDFEEGNLKEMEPDKITPGHKELLEEQVKDIIISAAELVQKAEDKDDSGKKDSEDITKEPSSLSPDKFDSSEKKTTDTDIKPGVDQKDQQVPEKLEESHERMSTLESGATTTAPTLPEDERIPLDEIKEVINEKYLADQEQVKNRTAQANEPSIAPIPTEPKPDAKPFEVHPALHGIQREIVKTPDEVADLPVHEEVDPTLYRIEDFEKTKEEKPSQVTVQQQPQQQETKEPETPQIKEQKGVFSFFGKVADKFEKGIDKLTGKSRRDSEKDIDEKSSSKSSSPKEIKSQNISFPDDVGVEEISPVFAKVGQISRVPEAFEESEPEISKVKMAAIKDTAKFLQDEITDLQKISHSGKEWKKDEDTLTHKLEAEEDIKTVSVLEPALGKSILTDDKYQLENVTKELGIEEDAEEVEALLEEASKKFKTVKDSLRDSLESLEEKIAEEEMVRVELAAVSKDVVKDTLSEVVEKLEDIKPHEEDDTLETREPEKLKFDVPEDGENEIPEDLATATKDFKEAVRDVGEVLAGSAGILIEEKQKDVLEIVKKVAEVLKKDDFLSHDVLFDENDTKGEEETTDNGATSKRQMKIEEIILPKKVGITEELPPQEEIGEMLEGQMSPSLMSYKIGGDLKILEDPCVKVIKAKGAEVTSPVTDPAVRKTELMEICADLMQDAPVSSERKRSVCEDQTSPDVMEAGIEEVCIEQKLEHPMSVGVDKSHDMDEPNIVFDRKVSPATAEVVMVTPDLSPASPKFLKDAINTKEIETALEITEKSSELPNDLKNALLHNEEPLSKVIEDLVFTRKKKITWKIIEYLIVIRKIPREKVMNIIEELIIQKSVPRESVVADLDLLRPDAVSIEQRREIERYIDEEFIMKKKKITMKIVEQISLEKLCNKRIIIEIIEEIIIKKKIPRDEILDISEEEFSELDSYRKDSSTEQDEVVEPSKMDDTEDGEVRETILPTAGQYSEIENWFVTEIISTGKKITPQAIDDICVTKLVPRCIFIKIIEELVVKRNIPRSSVFDISEKELSEILASEKEHDVDEVITESDNKLLEITNYISDEFITKNRKITPQIFKDISARNDVSRQKIVEIIEKIVVERKMRRSSIFDISDDELAELLTVEEEEIESVSTAAASGEKLVVVESDKIESVTPERSEIENSIVEEYILKGKRITPYIFEDICIRHKVPRRIILTIIEEIVMKRNVKRNTIIDISDTELSELLTVVEAEGEEGDEVNVASIPKQSHVYDDVGEDKLVDGFVSIQTEDEVSTKNVRTMESGEHSRKESEKDVVDDFEAVEQEYKIHGVPITSDKQSTLNVETTKSDEKITGDIEEAIEDDVSDVVEATEKTSEIVPMVVAAISTEIDRSSEIIDKPDRLNLIPDKQASEISGAIQSPIKDYPEVKEDLVMKELIDDSATHDGLKVEMNLEETKVVAEEVREIEETIVPQIDTETVKDITRPKIMEIDEEHSESKHKIPITDDIIDIPRAKRDSHDVTEQTKDALTIECLDEVESKIEQSSPEYNDSLKDISTTDETTPSSSTVRRMVVTASSEDGGQETEVCPTGSIIYTPEDSLKSSPVKTTPDQDSLRLDKESLHSGISTPEKDSISDKSTTGTKSGDKMTPQDSLDRSPFDTRDSQDLEDSLDKSDRSKLKEMETAKADIEDQEDTISTSMDLQPKIASTESVTPKIADNRLSQETQPLDQRKLSSTFGDDRKEFTELAQGPDGQIGGPKLATQSDEYDSKDQHDRSTRFSVSHEKVTASHHDSKSISPSTTDHDDEDATEIGKSPSVECIDSEASKLPSSHVRKDMDQSEFKTADDHREPDDTKLEKSKSPSVASEKHDEEETQDHSRSPSFTATEYNDPKEFDHESRSSSLVSEKVVDVTSTDRPELDGICGDEFSVKETVKLIEKSESPSVVCETLDEKEEITNGYRTDQSRSPSIIGGKHEGFEDMKLETPKSASITTGKLDEKELLDGSLSPSSRSEHQYEAHFKEPVGKSRSLSPVSDEGETARAQSPKDPIDSSKSSGMIIDYDSERNKIEQLDKSKSPSINDEEHEVEVLLQRSRTSSIVVEKEDEKKLIDRSRSSSIDVEKPVGKDPIPVDRPQSTSIAAEKEDEKDLIDRSKSPSMPADQQHEKGPIERSRLPSIVSVTQDGKELLDRSRSSSISIEKQDEKVLGHDSTSPNIAVEKEVEIESIDPSSSPSISAEKQDQMKPTDRSSSPSTPAKEQGIRELISRLPSTDAKQQVADTPIDRSRSPSIAGEKRDEKGLLDRSRSPSISTEKQDEKVLRDGSRSPSISTEKLDEKVLRDGSRSPSIAVEKEVEIESIDHSRSPSISAEKQDQMKPTDRSRSPSIAAKERGIEELVFRSPSIGAKQQVVDEPIDRSRSSSIAAEKQDGKGLLDQSRSSSISTEKQEERELDDGSKSPSIAGEKQDGKGLLDQSRPPSISTEKQDGKGLLDQSRSSSISTEKHEERELDDGSKSPSIAGEKQNGKGLLDQSRSPSISTEKQDEKVLGDDSRSPSIAVEKEVEMEPLDSSRSSSISAEEQDQMKPTDRSRSPSTAAKEQHIEEPITGSKSPSTDAKQQFVDELIDRSRSPSIAGEKKAGKEAIDGSRPSNVVSEKQDEPEPADYSRSSSVTAEDQDRKILTDHAGSPSTSTEKGVEKEPADRSRSSSIVTDTQNEKLSINRSRSLSIAAENQGGKEPIDGSRSPSITAKEEDEHGSFDHSRSPSIGAEKPDGKEPIDRSRSSSITPEKQDREELVDHPKSPLIAAEKEDEPERSDQSQSSSIAVEKLGGKEQTDGSRSSSITPEKQDKEELVDHTKSPLIAAEKEDEPERSDQSQSSSIAVEKLGGKEQTDGSRSSSITPEKQDKEELVDHTKSPLIAAEKEDEPERSDQSQSSSIAVEKLGGKEQTDGSRSSSITPEKQDKEELVDHTKSPLIAAEKEDEPERSDQSQSSSIAAEKLGGKEQTDRSRSSSITPEKQDKEELVDHTKSPLIAAEKEDEPERSDQSQSSSIAAEKLGGKEQTDRSRSSSITPEKQDKEELVDHTKSPLIAAEKEDEPERSDQSQSSSIAAEKLGGKEQTDRSRSSSITREKQDKEELVDHTKSPLIAVDKEDEPERSDQSQSSSIAVEKLGGKEQTDRSRSSSITPEKQDKEELVDHTKSPLVAAEKEDELEPFDQSQSSSIAAEKLGGKEQTDRSRSSSISPEKQDKEELVDHTKSPLIAAEKEDEPERSDQSQSSSIAAEKLGGKEQTDRSRSSSITPEKQDKEELVDHTKSPLVAAEKEDELEPFDQSQSSSIAAEKLGGKEQTDRSRSSSITPEKQDKEELVDHTKSPLIAADKVDEPERSDQSQSSSIAVEKLGGKEQTDRSRSSSITPEKQDKEELVDHTKSPLVAAEKEDELEPFDQSRSSSIAAEKLGGEEPIDRSRSSSITPEKQDKEEPIDHPTSPSLADEKEDEHEPFDRSPSIDTEKLGGKESIDRSRSSSITVKKRHEEKPVDHPSSPSIVAEKDDEHKSFEQSRSTSIGSEESGGKVPIDRWRSSSITVEKRDEEKPVDHPSSPSIAAEREDEPEPFDQSRSSSIAADKFGGKEPIDRSRSSSISPEKQDKEEPFDHPTSPNIVSEKQDKEEPVDHPKSPSIAAEEEDEHKPSDRSPSIIAEKLDGKEPIDQSRSSSITIEKRDEEKPVDHLTSPSIVAEKEDEPKSFDQSRSPSIVSEKSGGKVPIDQSRSSSITSEKQDKEEPFDHPTSPNIVSEKQDKDEPVDHPKSPSIAAEEEDEHKRSDRSPSIIAEKLGGKEPIDRSRSSSITVEKRDEEKPVDHPSSPSIVAEKEDEHKSFEQSRSTSIAADKLGGNEPIDRSRSSSITLEKQDDEEPIDHPTSPTIVSEKQDKEEPVDHPKSPSIAAEEEDEHKPSDRSPSIIAEKLDGKEPIDQSRSSSITIEKRDEEKPVDHLTSPSIVAEKEDEPKSFDQSRSPSIVSEKSGGKVPIDQSRSSSITSEKQDDEKPIDHPTSPNIFSEKQDKEEPVDHPKSPSIAAEKEDENKLLDRSPSIVAEELGGKEPIDRSRSSSITIEKRDEDKPVDHPSSPSIVAEKEDEHKSFEQSRSPSIVSEKSGEKVPIDRSRSSSIAPEKQDEEKPIEHPTSPSTVSEKQHKEEPTSHPRSSSITGEKQDGKEAIDHSKSPSITDGKLAEKEPISRSRSPSIATEKVDEKELFDRSRSPSFAAEEQEGKETFDRSRSSSISAKKSEETTLLDHSRSPSIPAGKHGEEESIDHSRSPSISVEKQNEKEPIDRSTSSSVVAEKSSEKEPINRSRSSSIAAEKSDKQEPSELSTPSSIAPAEQDIEEPIESSKSLSTAVATHDHNKPADGPKSPGMTTEERDAPAMIDCSRSPSIVVEQQDGRELADQLSSSSIIAEEKSFDQTRSDEKEPISQSRSPTIVDEKLDDKEPICRSRSPSIAVEKQDEKESTTRSRSSSIAVETQDEIETRDRSRSSSINTDITDENKLNVRSVSPNVRSSDTTEALGKIRTLSISSIKTDDPTDPSGSASTVETVIVKSSGRSRTDSLASEQDDEKHHEHELSDHSGSLSGPTDKLTKVDGTQPSNSYKMPDDKLSSPSSTSDKYLGTLVDSMMVQEKFSPSGTHSEKVDDNDLDVEPRSLSQSGDKPDDVAHRDLEKLPCIAGDGHTKYDTVTPLEKTKPPTVASEGPIEKISLDRSRSSSIEHTDKDESPTKGKLQSIPTERHDEHEPIDLSKSSAIVDDKVSDDDKSRSTSIVGAHGIDEQSYNASVHDSQLDQQTAVHALQKLADTIADNSSATKCGSKILLDEITQQSTPKDRSRSHSLFDADEKTPLGRSRTASLFEAKVPEVTSTSEKLGCNYIDNESDQVAITKDETSIKSNMKSVPEGQKESQSDSKKSSVSEFEDTKSKQSCMAIEEDITVQLADAHTAADDIARVNEYIANRYIMKKEKITSPIIDEIVTLYSMPRNVILELIEDIIVEKNVPRDVIVDFPRDNETYVSAVASKDVHDELIDIPAANRLDIETYIHEELTNNKKISSKMIDELAALKSISRHIIIIIIKEMIINRKLLRPDLIDEGILDESTADVVQSAPMEEKCTESESLTSHHSTLLDDRRIEEDNLPATCTKSEPDSLTETDSTISEQKRVEIETYVMEECVKKGRKITILVLEQIMTMMAVPRSVLLDIIENIIVTRKMSRKGMVDDAIYDDVEPVTSKSPEYIPTKDRLVEFSGTSTPDLKSSGYSTPEVRQYEDKFGKEMSSYSTDYESPFHKAFVGGMTEIRTTHITTLSGKSTPDYSVRGETPESLSENMRSSSQMKFEEKFIDDKSTAPHTSGQTASETCEQAASIFTTQVSMVTSTTTISTTVDSPIAHSEISVPSKTGTSRETFADDHSKMVTKDIEKAQEEHQLGDIPSTMKVISHKVYDEVEPEITTKIIRTEIITEEEPIIERKIIRKEIIEEEPEIITKVIRRTMIDQSDEVPKDYEVRTISRSSEERSPEIVEVITVRTTEITEDIPQSGGSKIQTMPEKIMLVSESMDVPKDYSAREQISADIERTITTVTTLTELDGKICTHKTMQKTTDTLEDADVLGKVMDDSSITIEDIGGIATRDPMNNLKTERITTETIKTVTLAPGTPTPGTQTICDSDTSIAHSTPHDEKSESLGKTHTEKILLEKLDHPISPIIKDLISGQRRYSGESSPDTSLSKDPPAVSSAVKLTSDIPISPLTRDSTTGHAHLSGRSTPDKRPTSRSSTATPEGLRSNEVIRTTITTTRTMSEEGDIITTTMEITETTNEKGETTILEEKTDVKVEDRILPTDIGEGTFNSRFDSIKAPADLPSETDADPISPRSDHSSLHSRADTHVWGGSEERHAYSDEEAPGSPLSTTSQVGYSPQSTYHFGERTFDKGSSPKSMEFSEADMSSSFYGELPDVPHRVTTMKMSYVDSSNSQAADISCSPLMDSDFSFKKCTAQKDVAGASTTSEESNGKRCIDDADLDFEKVLIERKEMKRDRNLTSAAEGSDQNGSSSSSSSLMEEKKETQSDAKKDPLASWGTPLGLPSPKPPKKFNLRITTRTNHSTDTSPDLTNFDAINDWGEPLRLPSPAPIADEASNKGAPSTPKKERKQPKKVISENIKNRKRSESPSKNEKKAKDSKSKIQPVYMDLTYVPHHGNSYYTSVEFFKRVRARYYVFSGTEPSREVYDALLDAKKTWEDKDLEVTMIPTYDTDTLGYWVADNEEALAANHIDLSPSASRCTINLQDHETSCSAYRLEF